MSRATVTRLAVAALVAIAAVALVATAVGGPKRKGGDRAVVAKLRDSSGKQVARAVLRQGRRGTVQVLVRAQGLKPGFHGFHIHERGVCEAPSQDADGKTGAFLSAGGHLKQGTQAHSAHAGDMPSLFADRRGRARAAFAIDSYRLRDLTEGDGAAVMIHASPDNFANIPDRYRSSEANKPGPDDATLKTGDSGDRVACGVAARRR